MIAEMVLKNMMTMINIGKEIDIHIKMIEKNIKKITYIKSHRAKVIIIETKSKGKMRGDKEKKKMMKNLNKN